MDNMVTLEYEVILHWVSVAFYAVSTAFFAGSIPFRTEKLLKPAMFFVLTGFLFHSTALLVRWAVTGHGPYVMKYEVLSSNAWVVIAIFLLVVWRYVRLRYAGIVAVPLGMMMTASGLFTNPEAKGLPPSLKGIWLVIHVIFNHLTAGALIIALGAAVLYLWKEKKGSMEFFVKLPSLEVLDAYSHKFVSLGFIFWSITVIAGAIWANEAWGRYWGWDPVETLSFITWLLFGLYLHLRIFFKWKGRKAAWMLALCFISLMLSVYFVPLIIVSLHTAYF